uniref:Uncharacterized protein n=1 Tax=Knipowitschia caucasica TaxID=637954 RepID=A0AAV2J6Q1_KNICA
MGMQGGLSTNESGAGERVRESGPGEAGIERRTMERETDGSPGNNQGEGREGENKDYAGWNGPGKGDGSQRESRQVGEQYEEAATTSDGEEVGRERTGRQRMREGEKKAGKTTKQEENAEEKGEKESAGKGRTRPEDPNRGDRKSKERGGEKSIEEARKKKDNQECRRDRVGTQKRTKDNEGRGDERRGLRGGPREGEGRNDRKRTKETDRKRRGEAIEQEAPERKMDNDDSEGTEQNRRRPVGGKAGLEGTQSIWANGGGADSVTESQKRRQRGKLEGEEEAGQERKKRRVGGRNWKNGNVGEKVEAGKST